MRLFITTLAMAMLLAGCKGDEDKVSMSAACDALLKCVAKVASAGFPALLQAYGTNSSCWTTPTMAAACSSACAQSLQTWSSQFPAEAACLATVPDAGVAGSDAGSDDGGAAPPPACKTVPANQDTDVDILFVIDNSGSMEMEQQNLKYNISPFIDALLSPSGATTKPNLRLGVVSTDLGAGNLYVDNACVTDGDKGKLQNAAKVTGCTRPTDPWIEYNGAAGTTNIPGGGDPASKVKSAFQCIAALGTDGCGFEQTLMSAKKALDPTANINPGFLRNDDACQAGRKDAILAVVYITDEDDCSAANPQLFDPSQQGLNDPLGPLTSFRCFEFGVKCECPGQAKCDRFTQGIRKNCVPGGLYLHQVDNFISFFSNLKKWPAKDPGSGGCLGKENPQRVVMAAIAGPTDTVDVGQQGNYPTLKPSCSSTQGYAVPAVRIKALVRAFAKELTVQEINDIKAKKLNIPYFVDANGKWREENFSTICTNDFTPALRRFAKRINQLRGTRCADFGK